jgi:hypothetical protein
MELDNTLLVLLVQPLDDNEFEKVIIFLWYPIMFNWDFVKSIFTAGFAGQGVLNEDPTVWLDGARQHPISFIGPVLA